MVSFDLMTVKGSYRATTYREHSDERGIYLAVLCSNRVDEFYIDPQDWPLVSGKRWFPVPLSKQTNYVAGTAIRKGGTTLLHRMIMGEPEGMQIDHRDGNGMNDRRYNLRICAEAKNKLGVVNRARIAPSGYRGVYAYKPTATKPFCWVSSISIADKMHTIGYFNDPVEAAKAWDAKARELRGEFAQLNFP